MPAGSSRPLLTSLSKVFFFIIKISYSGGAARRSGATSFFSFSFSAGLLAIRLAQTKSYPKRRACWKNARMRTTTITTTWRLDEPSAGSLDIATCKQDRWLFFLWRMRSSRLLDDCRPLIKNGIANDREQRDG